jgi:hypothetical protein
MKYDGLTTLATRAIANTPTYFTYGAVSEDSSAESPSGTTLTGELTGSGWDRAVMTTSNPTAYVTQWVHTWTAGVAKAIRKFAIFNAAYPSGNMLMEHLFPAAKNVGVGETLTVTAQMTNS